MENSDCLLTGPSPAPQPSLSTARHRPTQDRSAPYGGAAPYGPAGRADRDEECDLVTVPARQGLEAVDILRRGSVPAVGPVLHDTTCDTLGFLVPPGTADAWDMPGSACTQTFGRGTRTSAAPARSVGGAPVDPAPPVAGTGWLLPPADTGPVTDPVVLRAALGEAARIIEAADRCR